MSLIFISYAREDIGSARRLAQDLKRAGLTPWLDDERLLPGQRWKEEISKALMESDFVIVLLSSNSVSKRGYVQREIRQALEILEEKPGKIFLIPVRLDDAEPPGGALRDIHWLDLFPSWDAGVEKLIGAITPSERSTVEKNTDDQPASPSIVLAWDPDVLDESEYAELVAALGDLVRSEGGLGVERVNGEALIVNDPAGVLV